MLLMPPFYESNGFLTSIFHKQRQRLSEYRLCLCTTCGIRTIEHIALGGMRIPAFNDWKDMNVLTNLNICLPSRLLFVPRDGGEREGFFPGFLWLFFQGYVHEVHRGGDVKERKKSPLVSGLQRQHGEPSCHPAGIKGPFSGVLLSH